MLLGLVDTGQSGFAFAAGCDEVENEHPGSVSSPRLGAATVKVINFDMNGH